MIYSLSEDMLDYYEYYFYLKCIFLLKYMKSVYPLPFQVIPVLWLPWTWKNILPIKDRFSIIEKIRIEFFGFFRFDSDYIVIYLNYCSDVDFCNLLLSRNSLFLKVFLKSTKLKVDCDKYLQLKPSLFTFSVLFPTLTPQRQPVTMNCAFFQSACVKYINVCVLKCINIYGTHFFTLVFQDLFIWIHIDLGLILAVLFLFHCMTVLQFFQTSLMDI